MDRYLLRDLNKCLVGFQPAISLLNHTSADEDFFLNQVCVNSETQTVTTEILEETVFLTNVESGCMIPPHKTSVAPNAEEILIANEATDVEGWFSLFLFIIC